MIATDPILLPDPEGLEVLHDREYRVRAYRLGDDRILIRGAVRDQKPPGLYIRSDPEPMTIHHMQVDVEVSFPGLEILDVAVRFEMHPRDECPTIVEHYEHLVGLSIARGFTHKVRELFGGPRGCTHTTALLQAMAPVAVQCFYSMRAAQARIDGTPDPMLDGDRYARDQTWRMNIGTCHVWAADGEAVASREAGRPEPAPVFIRNRLERLGLRMPEGSRLDDLRAE
ncbi:MAG: DUF2889 domain-containing protein [Acidimicrobiia bacterium]